MSATNSGVPAPLDTALPNPVPGDEHERCPVTDVLRRIGDKWTVLVVVLLGRRPHRFNELHRSIEAISQRMLTRTLRGLEGDGLVRREVFATNPPSVEYSLTPLGRSLLEPLSTLAGWAVANQPAIAANRLGNDPSAHSG
ncbi:winged helix-turn-helix transcriptional regulator [Micromonospora sp. NPDC004336]